MKDRIKLSEVASYYLVNVKQRLNLRGQDDYMPMRIAIGRSLQSGREPNIKETEIPDKEKRRKEVQLTTFEQGQRLYFQALISQKYYRKVEDDDYVDILTKHIEHGLWLIFNETEKVKGYDYFSTILSTVSKVKSEVKAAKAVIQGDFSEILRVKIGRNKATKQDVFYDINTANNPHFGIMGGSGSGKTYFLKHLLTEIRKNSAYETNFVIFDYKDGDIAKDDDFRFETNAEVIDVKRKPLPLNLFHDVGNDEREQMRKAEQVVEIVKNVEANIGKVQEDNLYNAILNAYRNTPNSYPDFEIIRDELQLINDRPDSLTSVLRPLVDQHYFVSNTELIYEHWTNKTLIIDIHEIERKDLVCFFVLNQIFQELKKLGVAPVDEKTGARKIRTVVVIDEAHNFLESKKRSSILAKMIREVRSAGGAVILASQSPDDYDRSDFNFLELMEFPIVLKSTPSSHKFLEQKFSLTPPEAKEMLLKTGKLNRGEAYILHENKAVLVELG